MDSKTTVRRKKILDIYDENDTIDISFLDRRCENMGNDMGKNIF
jgi:hypothetical protein